jgi:hypothetical protein
MRMNIGFTKDTLIKVLALLVVIIVALLVS